MEFVRRADEEKRCFCFAPTQSLRKLPLFMIFFDEFFLLVFRQTLQKEHHRYFKNLKLNLNGINRELAVFHKTSAYNFMWMNGNFGSFPTHNIGKNMLHFFQALSLFIFNTHVINIWTGFVADKYWRKLVHAISNKTKWNSYVCFSTQTCLSSPILSISVFELNKLFRIRRLPLCISRVFFLLPIQTYCKVFLSLNASWWILWQVSALHKSSFLTAPASDILRGLTFNYSS